MSAYCKSAEAGNHFVLTEKGYEQTPEPVKPERRAGEPVRGVEYSVPTSWLKKGYVEERGERPKEG